RKELKHLLLPINTNLLLSLELSRAFSIDYKDNDDFICELKEQLNVITNSEGYFNYLPVIQSSGYGKIRAVCQLAKSHPLIYVCFHSKTSTGHPPATPKSNIMHQELMNMKNIDEAHTVAFSWLRSMIQVFCEMGLEKKSEDLLYNESFSLLVNKNKTDIGFRAIRKVLLDLRQYSYDILTDPNSSVANLALSKEDDPSARGKLSICKPFFYISTHDCLRGFKKLPHEDDDLGYSIIQFDIICLAKQKLLGGVVSWKYLNEVDKKIAALAVVSSVTTTCLSSFIYYKCFEPVMSEAALELLSEKNVEFEILGELGNTFQSGGILDAGSQGEPVVRLLFLGTWCYLISSKRGKSPNNKVKNYKDKQSQNTMRRKTEPSLSPEIVFTEELKKCIGKNNLGIYLNIGQAYMEEPFIQPCFYDRKKVTFDTDLSITITTRSQSTFKLPEDKLYN
ncbi:7962_t:CDS:10, partial [Funneliformis caledonium]